MPKYRVVLEIEVEDSSPFPQDGVANHLIGNALRQIHFAALEEQLEHHAVCLDTNTTPNYLQLQKELDFAEQFTHYKITRLEEEL